MKFMKTVSVFICILAIACLFAGCVSQTPDGTPDDTPDVVPNEMIVVTDVDTWDQIISESTPVIVQMYADWCSDCQAVKPAYEEMPEKYPNVTFAKIDIAGESNILLTQEFSQRYGIGNGDGKTIPDFKLFINGEYAYSGFLNTPEDLEQYVEDVANGKIPDVEHGQIP